MTSPVFLFSSSFARYGFVIPRLLRPVKAAEIAGSLLDWWLREAQSDKRCQTAPAQQPENAGLIRGAGSWAPDTGTLESAAYERAVRVELESKDRQQNRDSAGEVDRGARPRADRAERRWKEGATVGC